MSHRSIWKPVTLIAALAMGGCALEEGSQELVQSGEQDILSEHPGYIVVFKAGTQSQSRAAEIARQHGITVDHVYSTALKGFSFRGSEVAAQKIAQRADVEYVEEDQYVSLIDSYQEVAPAAKPGGAEPLAQTTPWGIARVGGPGDGTGKTSWIIDTGIDLDHPDLNVDVARSKSFVRQSNPDDGNGHGTHVAGTVAALNNGIDVVGVAAGAKVVAVRVLDNSGSGTWSGVIAGIDYVAANGSNGDSANMSLGGGYSKSVNDAVINAASKGIKFAVAAGNSGAHAKDFSPASANHTNIYTVSATASNDCLTSWSNYGNPPVDVAAPGNSILSTKKGGGTTTMSGTSMASPHVAGLLLLGAIGSDGNACGDPDGNPDSIAHR